MSDNKTEKLAEWCDFAATTGDMGRKPDPKTLYRQAAAELRRLDAVNRELLEALREIEAEAAVFGGGFGSWISMRARAAIAKATDV